MPRTIFSIRSLLDFLNMNGVLIYVTEEELNETLKMYLNGFSLDTFVTLAKEGERK